ncbi:MAG: LysR family transcriptional regulator [Dehalococcoidia bacterium]|nr:LysR family transcriptional regulator [Dehalococcoidia bacterium]
MELRELRSFCTAAHFKSITKASEHLNMGQPAVTGHIRKLEEEMGVELFDRVKRPIRLTEAGDSLYKLAAPLVEGLDNLQGALSDSEQARPIRIGSTFDSVSHALLPAVNAFLSQHPHSQLRVKSGSWKHVLEMVQDKEVDLGLVPGPSNGVEFDFHPLFPYERVLIAPLGHPILDSAVTSLDEIARWPLILRGEGTSTRSILETEFRRKGLPFEVVVELDSIDMIKAYVRSGLGISVGPKIAMEPGDEQFLGIIDLMHLFPVEQAGVVPLRGKDLSPPINEFIRTLEGSFGSSRIMQGAASGR